MPGVSCDAVAAAAFSNILVDHEANLRESRQCEEIALIWAMKRGALTRRALLVGINEFKERLADKDEPVKRRRWELGGCVNDVRVFKELLVKYYGFADTEDEIKVLENEEGTRKGILKGLKWLLNDSDFKKDGSDVRVFQISSHGTFVDDRSGDEPDGRDEVIVPHVHDWKRPFRDDKLREIFDGIPPNVNFTFVADCCHGGTVQGMVVGSQSARFSRSRALEPPTEILLKVYEAEDRAVAREQELEKSAPGGSPKKTRYGLRDVARHALLAACRADETAAESTHGVPRGAFSWALERAIERKKGKLTYKQLIDRAGELLETEAQLPQLECPADWRKMRFLAPLGPGLSTGVHGGNLNDAKERQMPSNLGKFLAQIGRSKGLMKKGKMKKSLKNLTDEEIEILKSGDADRIESWIAAGGGDRPIDQHGGG